MLAEVVEKLKKTETGSPSHYYRKSDVSGLLLLKRIWNLTMASPVQKRPKLVKDFGNLQEKICSVHVQLLDIYCHTDQRFICFLCKMDKHKSHKTLPAVSEREEKQVRNANIYSINSSCFLFVDFTVLTHLIFLTSLNRCHCVGLPNLCITQPSPYFKWSLKNFFFFFKFFIFSKGKKKIKRHYSARFKWLHKWNLNTKLKYEN